MRCDIIKTIYSRIFKHESYALCKDSNEYIFRVGEFNYMYSNKIYFSSDTSAIKEFKRRFKYITRNYYNKYDIMFKFVE